MAARARGRWERVMEAELVRRADGQWEGQRAAERAEMATYNAGMTLGAAVAWLSMPPWGCACTGGPWCCFGRSEHARAMVRAAHVAVRLVADVAHRMAS